MGFMVLMTPYLQSQAIMRSMLYYRLSCHSSHDICPTVYNARENTVVLVGSISMQLLMQSSSLDQFSLLCVGWLIDNLFLLFFPWFSPGRDRCSPSLPPLQPVYCSLQGYTLFNAHTLQLFQNGPCSYQGYTLFSAHTLQLFPRLHSILFSLQQSSMTRLQSIISFAAFQNSI